MRHLRRTVLATFAVVLCAVPAAYAHDRDGNGAVVAPARGGGLTGGELLGESWATGLVLPEGENPFRGTCLTLARNVQHPSIGEDGTATCTVTQRTRLFVYFGSTCSNVEPAPFFGETEEEQLACAVAADRGFEQLNVTVDKRDKIKLLRRRFELFSPQRTIELPPNNVFGIPPRTATFTAHGWGAVIRNLRPGHHTVTLEVANPDYGDPFSVTTNLNVVRGGHSDHDDDD
jgi:hypothetical protein